MGILKSREELLPVTCAILKDDERDHFFAAARKKVGGNMDRLAHLCSVPVSVIQDWVNGKTNIPYHALQRLAQELEVELPAVSELRREYQLVVQTPRPRAHAEPPPPREEPKAAREDRPKRSRQPRKERAKPAPRQEKPRAENRPPQSQRKDRKPSRGGQPKPSAPGPGGPRPSDKLAYWTAVLFVAARYENGSVILSADRRIGQNFAATWASLTAELFGAKPALRMSEDRKVQEAALPAAGLEEFFLRLEFKPDAAPASAPGAPRWAWSNPSWKSAFLKGVVDSSAHFHRAPSLNLRGLSARLSQSVLKIFASLGLPAKAGPESSLVLEGKESVEKYFNTVGTANMKLRDQFRSYQRPGSAPAAEGEGEDQEEAPAPEAAAEPAVPAEEDLSVGPGNEALPPEPPEPATEEDLSVGPGNELHPKPKPAPKPQGRRRRTAFRGRPGGRHGR